MCIDNQPEPGKIMSLGSIMPPLRTILKITGHSATSKGRPRLIISGFPNVVKDGSDGGWLACRFRPTTIKTAEEDAAMIRKLVDEMPVHSRLERIEELLKNQ